MFFFNKTVVFFVLVSSYLSVYLSLMFQAVKLALEINLNDYVLQVPRPGPAKKKRHKGVRQRNNTKPTCTCSTGTNCQFLNLEFGILRN